MGKKTTLPKKAKVGTTVSRVITVNGKRRKITWKKTRPRGKNKNLMWKIISNKKA
ncbi:hypothetical protein LCGC14_3057700 [marine sediment metagenome]|uniref:Uncharacterized protein n=1 Tax=marine sediment metagenome TaxID=412755 RepID=A0A0F8WJQ4_9ZZZZ